jgi:hypothetical protein
MPIPLNGRTGASYSGGTHFSLGKSGNALRNYGGTIFYAGNVGVNSFSMESLPSGPITQSIGTASSLMPNLSYRFGYYENLPYYGSTAGGVNRGISGDFAKVTAGRYIVYGYNTTAFDYIAGTLGTNTALQGNAGQHPWRNAFGPYIRTKCVITLTPNGGAPNGWSYVTGFLVNPQVNSADKLNAEVNPGSYAIPGDIIFLSTGKTDTIKVLPAKTD